MVPFMERSCPITASGEGYRPPAPRQPLATVRDTLQRIDRHPVLTGLLAGVDGLLAVLNRSRQVLLVNDALLRSLGIADPGTVLGLRPGEVVGCAHAACGPDGCGTGPACPSCGAAIALATLESDGQTAVERLCALRRQAGGGSEDLMLRVRAAPLSLDGQELIMLLLQDRTREHLSEAVERGFLHDLNNQLCALTTTLDLLAQRLGGTERELALGGLVVAGRMAASIALHRTPAGEASRMHRTLTVAVADLLAEVQTQGAVHPAAAGRIVAIDAGGDGHLLVPGRVLLGRILLNMVINACEATVPGGTVRLRGRRIGAEVELAVWNREAIPPAVVPRIFQRHFSTKEGRGRGQGTWAMKDLGERQLGGTVSFTSTAAEGTTFRVRVPLAG